MADNISNSRTGPSKMLESCRMRPPFLIAICLFGLTAEGCAVRELQVDHDRIRTTLLDLYTNQIIDNLVRAKNGMPIIQLDYSNASAQITVSETPSLNDSLSTTRSTAITTGISAGVAIMRGTVNALTGNIGGMNSNQVSLAASPVTTANEVYDAYLQFLALDGSLQVTDGPPPEGAAHICRKCGNQYYWVPVEFKKEFFGLALATTAQRGKALLPPEEFFTVTLKRVIGKPEESAPELFRVTVEIDKKIPNDSGRAVFKDGSVAQTDEYLLPPGQGRLDQTDKLTLYVDLKKHVPLGIKSLEEFAQKLPLADVKVYVRGHRPPPPTTTDLLNRVNFQLQQIQFNQLR